jgi:hypothetical protein
MHDQCEKIRNRGFELLALTQMMLYRFAGNWRKRNEDISEHKYGGHAPAKQRLSEVIVLGVTMISRVQPLDQILGLARNLKGNRW